MTVAGTTYYERDMRPTRAKPVDVLEEAGNTLELIRLKREVEFLKERVKALEARQVRPTRKRKAKTNG